MKNEEGKNLTKSFNITEKANQKTVGIGLCLTECSLPDISSLILKLKIQSINSDSLIERDSLVRGYGVSSYEANCSSKNKYNTLCQNICHPANRKQNVPVGKISRHSACTDPAYDDTIGLEDFLRSLSLRRPS